ncbi:dihydrofolate reductase [bacterium]|nr:dihydrofolate reductase [bacterium]
MHTEIEGDTFFDDLDENWKLVHEEHHPKDDRHPFSFTFHEKLLVFIVKYFVAFASLWKW